MSIIKAIFFAIFHKTKGPHVQHQVPEDSIVPTLESPYSEANRLFDFGAISYLIIPNQDLCDRHVTVCINGYRVISYPVCVQNPKHYTRNQFIFNFALVLDEKEDFSGYVAIVRKLATLFRNLEEQTGFLSCEEDFSLVQLHNSSPPSNLDLDKPLEQVSLRSKVYALCEIVFGDLNRDQECMIPIDESNTVNLKIFPTRPPPVAIHDWDVPLATVQLSVLVNSPDLTLTRILRFIDGVSSVARVAQKADTDKKLTRIAIAHLVYYRCVILLDIFQYSATYALTADIAEFVEDLDAQQEAIRYIATGTFRRLTKDESQGVGRLGAANELVWKADETSLNNVKLLELYFSLQQGLKLGNWCLKHHALTVGLDVRRFITYGVMKGFLYRVHEYAALDGDAVSNPKQVEKAADDYLFDVEEPIEDWRTSTRKRSTVRRQFPLPEMMMIRNLPLRKFLNGMHCMDEICTELAIGVQALTERMKDSYRNVVFIYR